MVRTVRCTMPMAPKAVRMRSTAVLFVFLLSVQPRQTRGFFGASPTRPRIPASPNDRDNQAIQAVKAALAKPTTPSFPLVECEFPPLSSLNKLGDGSLRSATQVDTANLAFCAKLIQSISPLPMIGPRTTLLLSSTVSNSFLQRAKSACKTGTVVHSLKEGLPTVGKGDVCVFVSPSSRKDYEAAQSLASNGTACIIINGFAKDQKSVPGTATVAYYLKPLTYNSQVSGYLIRSYPGKWTTMDVTSNEALGTWEDKDILVGATSSPDLREPGRLAQKSVDDRAIRSRQSR